MACQHLDAFAKAQRNWKTKIWVAMPVCIFLSLGLIITIVLYPHNIHTLQEINCSSYIDKNSMIFVRVRAVKDPEVEKLENVLAEGLPQSNVFSTPTPTSIEQLLYTVSLVIFAWAHVHTILSLGRVSTIQDPLRTPD